MLNLKDIREYIEDKKNTDSFLLEMRVAEKLTKMCYDVKHSGFYDDPITGKKREFDIQATHYRDSNRKINLAIECKAIKNPLLVYTVNRTENEIGRAHV